MGCGMCRAPGQGDAKWLESARAAPAPERPLGSGKERPRELPRIQDLQDLTRISLGHQEFTGSSTRLSLGFQ